MEMEMEDEEEEEEEVRFIYYFLPTSLFDGKVTNFIIKPMDLHLI